MEMVSRMLNLPLWMTLIIFAALLACGEQTSTPGEAVATVPAPAGGATSAPSPATPAPEPTNPPQAVLTATTIPSAATTPLPANTQALEADRKIAFPVPNEPLGTDLGSNYLAGELRAEDGCLKLYRLGWDEPERTVSEQLRDIWLPVWPSGFALRQEGQDIQVIDGDGAVAARAGDTVRFGGRSYWSDETGQEEIENTVPQACQGLYYLVGDEVSVVPSNKARVVALAWLNPMVPSQQDRRRRSLLRQQSGGAAQGAASHSGRRLSPHRKRRARGDMAHRLLPGHDERTSGGAQRRRPGGSGGRAGA